MENRTAVAQKIAGTLPRTAKRDDLLEFNLFQSDGVYRLMNLPEVQIGHINPARWRRMHMFLSRIGLLKHPMDLKTFIFDPEDVQKKALEKRQKMLSIVLMVVFLGAVFVAAWIVLLRKTVTHKTADLLDANRQLTQSETRLKTLLNTIPDLVWMKDTQGVYLNCNPMFERFFSDSESEIVGLTDYDFVDKTFADFFRENDRRAMQFNRPSINEEVLTFTDGGYRGRFETIKMAVRDGDGGLTGVLGVARDITDRTRAEKEKLRLERQLRQSQKMESIGTLAGGIAHDFNNILAAIIGFTELALEDASPGSDQEDDLLEIYNAGKRARDLVRRLLSFARQSGNERKPVAVRVIADEVINLMRASLPSTITIQTAIQSESLIMGNATEVHQIILNLCTNAASAMEDTGGQLAVEVKDIEEGGPTNDALDGLEPGTYVEIFVSDTGKGIPPDIQDSIFDPYFTTGAPSESSGMGLAVVHGIVESYRGKITVSSLPGEGAVFRVYLPTVETPAIPAVPESTVLPSGTERILFVDDEPALAKMGSQILSQMGYTVTARTSSADALALFHSQPDDFDLVIFDMTMPGMTSDRFSKKIMAIRPHMPIILCTGYHKKLSAQLAAETGVKALLNKPLLKSELLKTIRHVLDNANAEMMG